MHDYRVRERSYSNPSSLACSPCRSHKNVELQEEKIWVSTTPARGVAMATSIKDDGSWTGLCENTHTHTQYKHWQVKWITLIILSPWHLSHGGIYQAAGEQSPLADDDVLAAGKMGRIRAWVTLTNCGGYDWVRVSPRWQHFPLCSGVGVGGTLENSDFQRQSGPSQRGRGCELLNMWLNRVGLAQ